MRNPKSIVLLALVLASGFYDRNSSQAAESKCTTTSSVCTDGRTGEARTCVTTVCVDGDGKVLSTNTIVLRNQQGTKTPTEGHVPTSTTTLGTAKTPVSKQPPSGGATPITEPQHNIGSGTKR